MERTLKKVYVSTKSLTIRIKCHQITSCSIIPLTLCTIYLHYIDVNDIIHIYPNN